MTVSRHAEVDVGQGELPGFCVVYFESEEVGLEEIWVVGVVLERFEFFKFLN